MQLIKQFVYSLQVNVMAKIATELLTHHSYWIREAPPIQRFEKLSSVHKTEVAIIGAGVTGLSAGIELLERGYKVTVLEALVVGGGTTAASSGHVDAHPEGGPTKLVKSLGEDKARVATQFRIDAINLIEQRADSRCDFKRIKAYQYAENVRDESVLMEELDAAKRIGLKANWVKNVPLPYSAIGYEIDNMGRFQSMAYLERLLQLFVEKGGKVFEHSVASGPVEEQPTELKVGNGKIEFEQVVCAVHCNYTNAMRIYLQTPAYQSYVLAVRVKDPCFDGLFWDNSNPYFYTRRAHSTDPKLIIVGGCDHRTGVGDANEAKERLQKFVHEHYEVEEIVWSWSAELFEPTDGLPIIGKVPGKKNVWIATGLSGVGLTWGTAAAKIIADQMDGKSTALQDELSPARFGISSAFTVAGEQLTTAANFAERILPAKKIDLDGLKVGEGEVGIVDGKFTAVCRDQSGKLHSHNPRCVHMGGVVHWNPVEQSWDCPVHGGRYAACGARIYSPPEADLVRPDKKSQE